MEEHITKFISHEYRRMEYEKMVEEISIVGGISTDLARKYTERALKQWETKKGTDILTLFTATPLSRHEEITAMTAIIRDYLRPIIFSSRKLDRSINTVSDGLERLYHLY